MYRMEVEMTKRAHDVIKFWQAAGRDQWFAKDNAFDEAIDEKFGALWQDAAMGKLNDWQKTSEGSLALLLILDQFSRNLFRSDARAFSCDAKARLIAQNALEQGFDQEWQSDLRAFFYLPFEHSEDLSDQEKSLTLFKNLGDDAFYHYAEIHADIIKHFGRFPHRNAILGRKTTAIEQEFLNAGGFAG